MEHRWCGRPSRRRRLLQVTTAVVLAAFGVVSVPAGDVALAQDGADGRSGGICNRTQQVQDAILESLPSVSECADVTGADLSGITGDLTLSEKKIATLKPGDFQGLDNLQSLYLDNNELNDLPDGIFEGLRSLDILWLNFNPGSPFALTVELKQWSDDSVQASVREGAPFDIQVTLSAEGGTLSSTTVTIEAGDSTGDAVNVTASGSGQVTVSVASLEYVDYTNYFGLTGRYGDPLVLTLAAQGICGRTQKVQDAILRALSDVDDCANVTESDLSGITGQLTIVQESVGSLRSGDLAGLTGLTWLRLDHNRISTLPGDIFDDLDSLETLELDHNSLNALPEDAFAGLGNLKKLDVNSNRISALPEDVFDGLAKLETLFLDNNPLGALPEDIFDGLARLKYLRFSSPRVASLPEDIFDGVTSLTDLDVRGSKRGSSLTTLPEDVFDGLASLRSVKLSNNNLSALPEDVFDGLGNLDVLNLSNNSLSALPEDVFDGLGRLRRVDLSHNSLDSLPGGVFNGLGNLRDLVLNYNRLNSLPAGLFEGLGRLDELELYDNPGVLFFLRVQLKQVGDSVVVEVVEGAPYSMSVGLSASGATLSTTTLTIAAGSLQSAPVTFVLTGDGEASVTIANVERTYPADGYFGGIVAPRGASLTLSSATDDTEIQNTPASGAPTISGTAQVGHTLTADTSAITDADGLTSATYDYQWIANDGSTGTGIDGATGATYELQATDAGKTIQVRVDFTDDAGNSESLTSAATAAVGPGGV